MPLTSADLGSLVIAAATPRYEVVELIQPQRRADAVRRHALAFDGLSHGLGWPYRRRVSGPADRGRDVALGDPRVDGPVRAQVVGQETSIRGVTLTGSGDVRKCGDRGQGWEGGHRTCGRRSRRVRWRDDWSGTAGRHEHCRHHDHEAHAPTACGTRLRPNASVSHRLPPLCRSHHVTRSRDTGRTN